MPVVRASDEAHDTKWPVAHTASLVRFFVIAPLSLRLSLQLETWSSNWNGRRLGSFIYGFGFKVLGFGDGV